MRIEGYVWKFLALVFANVAQLDMTFPGLSASKLISRHLKVFSEIFIFPY